MRLRKPLSTFDRDLTFFMIGAAVGALMAIGWQLH